MLSILPSAPPNTASSADEYDSVTMASKHTYLFIEMRYQYFHGSLGGLQFGGLLATSGSGSVFNSFEQNRTRVGLRGILQFAIRVFRRDLQYVLNVLV